MRRKKASILSRFFSRLLWVIALIVTIFFGYTLFKLNMLPIKYYLIILGIMFVFLFIIGAIVLRKHLGKTVTSIVAFITVVYITIFLFGALKIDDTITFMEKNLGIKVETNLYYVLVNNDSEYEKIKDIKGETVYSYKDSEDMERVESGLLQKVKVDIKYRDSIYDMLQDITIDKNIIVYVNSGTYDVMTQNSEGYSKKVRILDSVEIKTKKDEEENNINVTNTPFVILINGVDTRTDYLPSRSLSDVNMLMAVNPNTHEILLLSIPRDYYLTIPGTNGAKDKLTHTGTIGGVNTTIATLEDTFGIDISYYVRVNFNFVINLVDAVGGIDIYNDQPYTFSCWAESECYFEPGVTYDVSGRCALAFARERYAYDTGDRHRIQNQQQVLEKLFNKITSSKTLITSYSDILNSLNGTFETNLSNDDISKLVKMQIKDMPDWTIYQYSVDGYGDSTYTYSYPNQELYVMVPDGDTINEAISKLNNILRTESNE